MIVQDALLSLGSVCEKLVGIRSQGTATGDSIKRLFAAIRHPASSPSITSTMAESVPVTQ